MRGGITEGKRSKTDQSRARDPHRVIHLGAGHELFPGRAGHGKSSRTAKAQAQCLPEPHKALSETLKGQRVLRADPFGESTLMTHGARAHQQRGGYLGHPLRVVLVDEDMPGVEFSRLFATFAQYSRERDYGGFEQETRRSGGDVQ